MQKDFIKKLSEEKIFEEMSISTDILSELHIDNWLLYGSTKANCEPYELTKIYERTDSPNGKSICNTMDITFIGKYIDGKLNKSTINQLVRYLSVRKFKDETYLTPLADTLSDEKLTSVVDTKLVTDTSDEEKLIPVVDTKLVTDTSDKEKLIPVVDTKLVTDMSSEEKLTISLDTKLVTHTSDENLIIARKLVKLLSAKRAEEYSNWYEVGCVLNNIDDRLLEDWIEFSKYNPIKFNENECRIAWKKMKPSIYTMRSLHYFASVDNPAYHMELKKQVEKNSQKRDVLVAITEAINAPDTSDMPPLMSIKETSINEDYFKDDMQKEPVAQDKVNNEKISGVTVSHCISEPITTSSLNSFHKLGSGGVIKGINNEKISGITVSHCIGEPVAASSLNSFHKSSSVTNSLPRVKELLNISGKNDNSTVCDTNVIRAIESIKATEPVPEIISYYGQEDLSFMNKSAMKKGLIRAEILKKYIGEIKKNSVPLDSAPEGPKVGLLKVLPMSETPQKETIDQNNSATKIIQPKEKQILNLKEIVAEMKALNITKIQIKKDSVKVDYKMNSNQVK
jgi:hypothetical protein